MHLSVMDSLDFISTLIIAQVMTMMAMLMDKVLGLGPNLVFVTSSLRLGHTLGVIAIRRLRWPSSLLLICIQSVACGPLLNLARSIVDHIWLAHICSDRTVIFHISSVWIVSCADCIKSPTCGTSNRWSASAVDHRVKNLSLISMTLHGALERVQSLRIPVGVCDGIPPNLTWNIIAHFYNQIQI